MTHRSITARMLLTLALGAAVLPGLGGCGYSTKPLYPTSVETVAVPIWGNKTFRRDWEFRLTEAIAKNLEARTPYRLAAQERADTVLSGEIVAIDETVLTRRYGSNLPRETQLTIVVDFTWTDLRSGRVLVKRAKFNRSATELPQLSERVTDAEQWAIEKTAAAIVEQLQTPW